MPFASASSFVSLGKETTRGTASGAPLYLPVTGPSPFDNVKYLEDKGIRGSMVENYALPQGVKFHEYAFGGNIEMDSIAMLIMAMLGKTTTSGAGPYTHIMSLLNNAPATGNQPPSYTVVDFNGNNARQAVAGQLAELVLKAAADGLGEFTARFLANATTVIGTPTNAPTTIVPSPGWNATNLVIAAQTGVVENIEITMKRNVTPIFTQDANAAGGSGSAVNDQDPYRLWAGPLMVTGKALVVYEADATYLTPYLAGTTQVMTFVLNGPNGANTNNITIQQTTAQIRSAKTVRGKDFTETEIEWEAVPNATDATGGGVSPCKITAVVSGPATV